MENIQLPAKRGVDENGSIGDRISHLPLLVLHRILSLLSQEDAVRTCILSKSWRHLGPTRPKIEFCEWYFCTREGRENGFLSVVENTLQRYDDQNLSIQEFILGLSGWSDDLFLNKWIPLVVMKNKGLKTFSLTSRHFSLPSVLFQSESLEELELGSCKLDQIKNCINVKLPFLKRLSLHHVYIEEETFQKLISISCCPLIEHVVLFFCIGFSTIKVNKAPNLKHFDCFISNKNYIVEMNDAPSLETIRIQNCQNWYHRHKNYSSTRVKSLFLRDVHLPTESFNNLSSNFPCLEELEIFQCSGFDEFKLSSRSIKRLFIKISDRPIKATIDAANMLYFKFRSGYPPSISFATISREWKSRIYLWHFSDSESDVLSTWYLKLYAFLKALSQSHISLHISHLSLTNEDTYDGDISCEPVVVEHLYLREYCPSYEVPALLNFLFRICRPKYIGLPLNSNSEKICERQLGESIWKTLVNKGETRECDFWQQDLEESSIQVSDKNTNEWRPGQVCEFSNNEEIRFRLKWRDLR